MYNCRQRKLEEALLFSGQFKDAIQVLLDWLYKKEPLLAEDQPVHGDLDTVTSLMEEHKVGRPGSHWIILVILLSWCKTAVTPLLTHWSYCSLALTHRSNVACCISITKGRTQVRFWTHRRQPLHLPHSKLLSIWTCRKNICKIFKVHFIVIKLSCNKINWDKEFRAMVPNAECSKSGMNGSVKWVLYEI